MPATAKMQPTAARALLTALQAAHPGAPSGDLVNNLHHMTIKAAYRKLTGRTHAEDGLTVEEIRVAMIAALMAGKPKTKREPKPVRKATLADLPKAGKWAKVVKITAHGKKGQPKRVEIRCAIADCETTREIATQDLFQVSHCCEAHRLADKGASNARVENATNRGSASRRTPTGKAIRAVA